MKFITFKTVFLCKNGKKSFFSSEESDGRTYVQELLKILWSTCGQKLAIKERVFRLQHVSALPAVEYYRRMNEAIVSFQFPIISNRPKDPLYASLFQICF